MAPGNAVPLIPTKVGIGVDFGMTYSGAAAFYLMGGNYPHLEPVPIRGATGKSKFPTRVFVPFEGNDSLVGSRAINDVDRGQLFTLFKRRLGTQWSTTVGTKNVTARSLTILVLKKIKDDIDLFLRDRGFSGPEVTKEYTFAYPGVWAAIPAKIDDLRHAIEDAGFPNHSMIEEPIATALAIPKAAGFPEILVGGQHILVCDLGGGTLDLADVTTTPKGMVRMQAAVSGDGLIGMSNLDKAIGLKACAKRDMLLPEELAVSQGNIVFGLELERAWKMFGASDAFKSMLLGACEAAKINICQDWGAQESVPIAFPDKDLKLLDATADLKPLFDAMNRAVQQSTRAYLADLAAAQGIVASDIHYVIIGGGGSALPEISETLQGLVPQARILSLAPEISTSLVQRGAAVHAHSPGMIRSRRVNASYGIKSYTDVRPDYPCADTVSVKRNGTTVTYYAHYTVYLKRGDEVKEVDRTFTPLEPNQSVVTFQVMCGENENPAANHPVGEVTLPLKPNTPVTYEVHCVFRLGKDGIISVVGEDRPNHKTSDVFKLTLELQPDIYS